MKRGFFYRYLPDRTHVFKTGNAKVVNCPRKDIVLATASMVEEKLPSLDIGKSANPRCFKSIKKLPLSYEFNKKAWMTATIFEAWAKKLNSRMRKRNRAVALVLDNCTADPNVVGLTNVKFIFLRPNTTAKTQPMDAGVICCLKSHYRKKPSKNAFIGI